MQNNKTHFFFVLYSDKTWVFDQSERAQSPIYILTVYRPFPSWLLPQSITKQVFVWNRSYSYEKFCTRTSSGREANSNLEIVYRIYSCISWPFTTKKPAQKIALDLYTSHTQRPDQAVQEINIIAWSAFTKPVLIVVEFLSFRHILLQQKSVK